MKENNQQKISAGADSLKILAESLDLPVSAEARLKAGVMKAVRETGQDRAVVLDAPVVSRQAWMPRFAFAVLAGVVFLGGTVAVSANSLPGDVLYPIKKVKEQTELRLAPQGQPKALIMAKHAEERLRELSDLKTLPAEEIIKHQKEVRNQANVQVNSAVESLSRVKQDLEDKGKIQAAESVNETLSHLLASAKKAEIELDDKVGSADEKKDNNETKEKDEDDREQPEGEVKGKWYKPETTDSKAGQQQKRRTVVVPKITAPSSTPDLVAPLLPNDSPNGAVLGTSTPEGSSSISEPEKTTEQNQEMTEEQKQAQEKLLEQQKQEAEEHTEEVSK